MRQVIFHSLMVVHHDRRTHSQRWNCKCIANHPFRSGKLCIKSKTTAVFVGDTLERSKNDFRLKLNRVHRCFILCEFLKGFQLCSRAGNLADFRKHRCLTSRADCCVFGLVTHFLESRHTRCGQTVKDFRCEDGLGTVQADDITQLFDRIEELIQIHRSCKFNVPKVSRAKLIGLFTGRTDLAVLNDSES